MSTDPLSLQRAAEAGASMSPCPIVATPVRPEDPLPLSDALPLTPSEAHYRDACAQSWRDQLTLKGHAQPDEGSLRDRVTQEIQFQKRATQLAHAFDDPPSTRVIVKSTWLELDAEVPPPHAASRDAREAWRLGDRWMPLVLELVGIAAAASVKDAPLSPRERAWCAGAGRRAFLEAEGNPDRRPLPEYVALMEQLARREKWRCREEGHRAGTRIVRIPVWEEPEAFHEAA